MTKLLPSTIDAGKTLAVLTNWSIVGFIRMAAASLTGFNAAKWASLR
jgi:hypothetical protein